MGTYCRKFNKKSLADKQDFLVIFLERITVKR